MTSTGWGSSLNSPPRGHSMAPLSSTATSQPSSGYSVYESQNDAWGTTTTFSLNSRLAAPTISHRPSFQPFHSAYSNATNGPIAITFRVLWGGPSTNLMLARPSATVMAPRSASSRLGNSTYSYSRPGGDTFAATKLDEMSNEHYYFQQLYLRDVQELGLRDHNPSGGDLNDMYIVRLPFTYILSLIHGGSTIPDWFDTTALREQLTHSFYSYNNETGAVHMNNKNGKDGILIHQVAAIIEQTLSNMWDWFPSMSFKNIMALMPLSDGQVIIVAHGIKTLAATHIEPHRPTRSVSMNSTINTNENSYSSHGGQTAMSSSSNYIGGGIIDNNSLSTTGFQGAVGRDIDIDISYGVASPTLHNSWINTSFQGGSDAGNVNSSFGVPDKHGKKTGGVHVPINPFHDVQDYENSVRSRSLTIPSNQSVSTYFPHSSVNSGVDKVNEGVASIDLSRSTAKLTTSAANPSLSMPIAPMKQEGRSYNQASNSVNSVGKDKSPTKPDPTSVIAPLLAMGFSQRQCDAAVLAIKNAETPRTTSGMENTQASTFHLDSKIGNVNHLLSSDDAPVIQTYRSTVGGVRLSPTAVESSYSDEEVRRDADIIDKAQDTPLVTSSTVSANGQNMKMVKVLDIPQDMNAFIFHCNASTRDECLERKMFGCPSGGQYGPHSKAKAGDLLFLADFSSWTVTGIFTAKTDAGLNLDKSAWGGKFPWQIRIHDWTALRTVHIDKVNEILGLASGSKLNMLSKDQLVKLVHSKEFGPCVPSSLFKLKPAPVDSISFAHALVLQSKEERPITPEKIGLIESPSKVLALSPHDDRDTRPTSAPSSLGLGSMTNLNTNRMRQVQMMNSYDEHPSAAMHRSKIVTAWFDVFSGEIVTLNELYNNRRSPQKKDGKKEKNVSDDLSKILKSECIEPWPTLSFTQVRQILEDVLYRWLQHAHAIGNEEGRSARLLNGASLDDSGSWLRQGRSSSSNGKKREDPVLLTLVPGSLEFVKRILQETGPGGLSVPTSEIADAIASKFLHDLEQFSADVRKTQVSSIRVGGDNYLKSIEDKTLSIRLSEVTSKYVDADGLPHESTIMKVEWYTKASLTQGRPPQVQKLDRECFDMLEKTYHDVTSNVDPEKTHFLTRLFVMLCRYDLFGDAVKNCQLAISSDAFVKMSDDFGVTHECFATPLTRICASYNSIFPDSDRYFGSLGSFFDFMPVEGSFFVNPPYGFNIKMTLEHIISILKSSDSDKNALSFLMILPKSADLVSSLESSQVLPYLKKKTVVALKDVDGSNSGGLLLIWLQNDFGHDLWTPTDEKVKGLLSTMDQLDTRIFKH